MSYRYLKASDAFDVGIVDELRQHVAHQLVTFRPSGCSPNKGECEVPTDLLARARAALTPRRATPDAPILVYVDAPAARSGLFDLASILLKTHGVIAVADATGLSHQRVRAIAAECKIEPLEISPLGVSPVPGLVLMTRSCSADYLSSRTGISFERLRAIRETKTATNDEVRALLLLAAEHLHVRVDAALRRSLAASAAWRSMVTISNQGAK